MNPCGTLNQQVRNERIDRIESIVTNDPWASVGSAQTAPAPTAPQTDAAASSLGGSYASEPEAQSSLFAPRQESYPILFNASHAPGTRIKGKVFAKPKNVQATCHPNHPDSGGQRRKMWWNEGPSGPRPGLIEFDPQTRDRNRPVENLVISMETDQRDPKIEGDTGKRSWFTPANATPPPGHVTGQPVANALIAVQDALKLAAQAGLRIASDEAMIGKHLEVCRVEREQPGVNTSSWLWQARITAD